MRKSTYVILAIGGAGAAAIHPADDDINEELQKSDTGSRTSFKPGKYLGSTYVQVGASVGTYLIGRLGKPGGSKTNKWSHIGFDLLRAQILDSALTQGIKVAVQRDRPTGECCSFPSGHASVTFATASVLERHFGYRGSWPMWIIASYVGGLTPDRQSAFCERRRVRRRAGCRLGLDRGRPPRTRHVRDGPRADPPRRRRRFHVAAGVGGGTATEPSAGRGVRRED